MTSPLSYALDPITWARECLHFNPDPWQARVLESPKNILLNCCRQSGKSTTAAVLATHRALFYPRSLVLMVSPSQRQSGELFRKVMGNIEYLEIRKQLVEDNALSLKMPNGSRIVSLPGSGATVRGFSGVSLIIEDEAAQCADELYYAIRPMLATGGGRLILMSTPFGRRGHFYESYINGEVDAWERIEIPATKCPRITADFLEQEKNALGMWHFQQEYLCGFNDNNTSLFSADLIEGAFDDSVTLLFPRVNINKMIGKTL